MHVCRSYSYGILGHIYRLFPCIFALHGLYTYQKWLLFSYLYTIRCSRVALPVECIAFPD